jgi:hypothetical protein
MKDTYKLVNQICERKIHPSEWVGTNLAGKWVLLTVGGMVIAEINMDYLISPGKLGYSWRIEVRFLRNGMINLICDSGRSTSMSIAEQDVERVLRSHPSVFSL